MCETRGKVGRSSNYVDVGPFWASKKYSEYHPDYQNCVRFDRTNNILACGVQLHDGLWVSVSVSVKLFIHNSSEPVDMCSKATPLAAMHEVRSARAQLPSLTTSTPKFFLKMSKF